MQFLSGIGAHAYYSNNQEAETEEQDRQHCLKTNKQKNKQNLTQKNLQLTLVTFQTPKSHPV